MGGGNKNLDLFPTTTNVICNNFMKIVLNNSSERFIQGVSLILEHV